MMLNLLMLAAGLALLVAGAEALVRGAAALALRLGVGPIVVGLTVVAFGTSTPELVVNVTASWRGQPELGFGNVIGSNIANIGLLLGLTAVVAPLAVHRSIIRREIPMLLLASVVALVLAEDRILTGRSLDAFNRDDGLVLLLLFGVFLYYTAMDIAGRATDPGAPVPPDSLEPAEASEAMAIRLIAALVFGGLIGLIVGGQLTIAGGTALARAVGIPDVVVGLTVLAVGTSLPELATCLAAARRAEADVAVGNVVGSNLFNLLFVFGASAAIGPIPLPVGGVVDLLVMLSFSAALLPLAITRRRVSRGEGLLLLVAYAGYVACLLVR